MTGSNASEVLRHPALDGVRHGFLGRRGGVSTGVCAGLNVGLGADDDPTHVAENRLRADALVTDRPGLALGILTADCAPVLFADREAGVIGAAHAGWKGAFGGVTDTTLIAMEALGAERARIAAVVGPCIAQTSYEVDDLFRAKLVADDAANDRFFAPGAARHYQFDLGGYVAARLVSAGVGTVATLDEDTYAQPERFFSYRRATHRGEGNYGRQISLIALD